MSAAVERFRAARARFVTAARELLSAWPQGSDCEANAEIEAGFPTFLNLRPTTLESMQDVVAELEEWADPAWDERAPMSTPLAVAAPAITWKRVALYIPADRKTDDSHFVEIGEDAAGLWHVRCEHHPIDPATDFEFRDEAGARAAAEEWAASQGEWTAVGL